MTHFIWEGVWKEVSCVVRAKVIGTADSAANRTVGVTRSMWSRHEQTTVCSCSLTPTVAPQPSRLLIGFASKSERRLQAHNFCGAPGLCMLLVQRRQIGHFVCSLWNHVSALAILDILQDCCARRLHGFLFLVSLPYGVSTIEPAEIDHLQCVPSAQL